MNLLAAPYLSVSVLFALSRSYVFLDLEYGYISLQVGESLPSYQLERELLDYPSTDCFTTRVFCILR